jgi:hypothetical protein
VGEILFLFLVQGKAVAGLTCCAIPEIFCTAILPKVRCIIS